MTLYMAKKSDPNRGEPIQSTTAYPRRLCNIPGGVKRRGAGLAQLAELWTDEESKYNALESEKVFQRSICWAEYGCSCARPFVASDDCIAERTNV
jgi:hypothetical protein